MVQMDAWSRILLKNSVSYSKFVSARTEWEGVNQMWAGADRRGEWEGRGSKFSENALASFPVGPFL